MYDEITRAMYEGNTDKYGPMNQFAARGAGLLKQRESSKFNGEQHQLYGGNLLWPGANGLPVKAEKPVAITDEEYESLPVTCDFNCRVFDLSKIEDANDYKWIRDRISNNLFTCEYIQRDWDPVVKNMVVYMEWSFWYSYLPEAIKNRAPEHATHAM